MPPQTAVPVLGTTPGYNDGKLNVALTGTNTGAIGGKVDAIVITVTDVGHRCPGKYR